MKEVIYGSYRADGSIAEEANRCILTGRPVNTENSVRERIPGTPVFYRVLTSQYHRATDELRAQWHAAAPQPPKRTKPEVSDAR